MPYRTTAPRIPTDLPASRTTSTGAALACIGAIGVLDVATGAHANMAAFYLLPILASGWYLGRLVMLVAVAAASSVWFLAELMTQSEALLLTSVWNGLTRTFVFAFAGVATHRLRLDRDALQGLNGRLQALLDRETALARTDALTGLANRRCFMEVLEERVRPGAFAPFGLVYLDLDRFKLLNDTYGHEAGDAALQSVADALREVVRVGDLAARLGGDEFAILVPGHDPQVLEEIGWRIRTRVERIAARWPEAGLDVSYGVQWCEHPDRAGEILRSADNAMYRAKRAGRVPAGHRAHRPH